ncbi:peptidylprolyl isomerase [soil metagenome]
MIRTFIRTVAIVAALGFTAAPAFAQNAAMVNGKPIPSARVDEIITELKKQGQTDTPELRNQIKDSLVMNEIFIQEAQKQKLLDRPDMKLALEQARTRIIVQALAQEYLKKNAPTDADLKAEYDTAKARAPSVEYRAHHILVDKEEDAKAIIVKLKGGAKFEDLAKQSKDTGSAANGGDLDWAPAGNYVPEFAGALQALQKGQTTDTPIKTQFGYHIIRLDDTRQAQFPAFDQVKPQLTEMVQQKKLADYQKQLRATAKIQ